MTRQREKGNMGLALALTALLLAAEAEAAYPGPGPAAGYQPSGYAIQPWTPGMAMAAYQKAYAMNFEIWKPTGLPSGWYATFDGFPVAQVAENRWVYGQRGMDGALIPTDVLVGSVVPSEVPGLARVVQAWGNTRYADDPEFRKIRNTQCDRMAYLNDPLVHTAIAWKSQEPAVWLWLGDRWKKLTPRSGEYTWQMLTRCRYWLSEQLRENGVWWVAQGEELADLARQWGMLWGGSLVIRKIDGQGSVNAGDHSDTRDSFQEASQSPDTPDNNGNWDVESVH